MKLLGRLAPHIQEVRADEVEEGARLAAGRYQPYSMCNVDAAGEIAISVEYDPADRLVYIVGCAEPGYAWTLDPADPVMIEKEA